MEESMSIVLSSPFFSHTGKVGAISMARAVAGVYFGGVQVIVPKDDHSLPVLKQAQKDRKKVICVFTNSGTYSVVVAVFVNPKGSLLREIKKDLNSFGKGDITLKEALERYTPKYVASRHL